MDKDEIVGTVLIDVSKAFDSIDHSLLLKKLDAYGVEDVEMTWFADYLSGKKQRVILDDEVSEWSDVLRGVSQGSILGSLLFNIYVNDLPDVANYSAINLYADDTTIYVTDRDPDSLSFKLSKDLQKITEWIERNGLKMNVGKTQLMVLGRKRSKSKANLVRVNLNRKQITQQTEVKYLGITIDEQLSWKKQVDLVRKKSLAGLAMIRRASTYLPSATRCLLNNALVLPHLDYCSAVYHSCNATLERVQKYGMCTFPKKPPRTRSEPLRRKLVWSTLNKGRESNELYQVHQCLLGLAPAYLCKKNSRQRQTMVIHKQGEETSYFLTDLNLKITDVSLCEIVRM